MTSGGDLRIDVFSGGTLRSSSLCIRPALLLYRATPAYIDCAVTLLDVICSARATVQYPEITLYAKGGGEHVQVGGGEH
jgi:hypothetical protein